MTFALLYCRVAPNDTTDADVSLREQERILVADATRLGFEHKVIVEDVASADGSADRLAEALDLLDEHHADVLMTVRLDRLEGRADGAESVLKRSAARGWGLIVAGEMVGPGPVSRRFQDHLDELAATRLRSERTRDGIQRRISAGIPFGRQVASDFLPTYRRVIGMYEDGYGLSEIARRLNAEEVPTARGGSWHASTVKAILISDTAKKLA